MFVFRYATLQLFAAIDTYFIVDILNLVCNMSSALSSKPILYYSDVFYMYFWLAFASSCALSCNTVVSTSNRFVSKWPTQKNKKFHWQQAEKNLENSVAREREEGR